jgi:hypothetical protein
LVENDRPQADIHRQHFARNSIHAMQGELETLKTGRAQYAHDPYGLIAASHFVAVEFATVAAANNYWR